MQGQSYVIVPLSFEAGESDRIACSYLNFCFYKLVSYKRGDYLDPVSKYRRWRQFYEIFFAA